MWRRGVVGLCVLVACATGPVERRHLADGSWQLTCRLPMDECVRHFEAVCSDKRYRILSGQSKRELRDVDPGTREYRTSEFVALCDRDALPPQVAQVGGPTAVIPPASSCVPGSTQSCVGPGGCSGGQACRADGAGFGPCDCGPGKTTTGDAGP
jgi:hypothetical protein